MKKRSENKYHRMLRGEAMRGSKRYIKWRHKECAKYDDIDYDGIFQGFLRRKDKQSIVDHMQEVVS